jgi:predicted amidohydrolase YtcJ
MSFQAHGGEAEMKNAGNVRGPADLAFIHGQIITVDADFSLAEGLAVRDGRIMAVGATDEILKQSDRHTRLIDLKGKTLLPGIIDSHIHLSLWSTTRPPLSLDLSYPNVRSIGDVVSLVGEKANTIPPGEWIRGYGWDESYFDEWKENKERHPTRWDLDAVSPDHPVALSDFTGGHIFWINTRAMELAGIGRNSPDPVGGNIIRDPDSGEPTGLLNEFGATRLVQRILPPWSSAQKRKGILASIQELNRLGVTSITEPGIGPNTYLGGEAVENDLISIYHALYQEGMLTLRVSILLSFADWLTPGVLSLAGMKSYLENVATNTGFGNEWLKIAGMKLGSDSMPLNKTSWMWEEYEGGGNGHLLCKGDTAEERYLELMQMIAYASKRRFQLGVHSTGDRAIDAVVDGFIRALKEDPWDARHYVIHADFTTPDCARRMAEHQIGAAVQSLIKRQISDLEERIVGPQRAAYEWPLKTLRKAGVRVANSSDAPVIYPDWRMGLEAAVTRESKASGRVSGPEERLTREEAIGTYTLEGAWLDHSDHLKGSIEVGKLADFVVLDRDILTIDPHDIHKIETLMTVVGGKIVYSGRPEEPAAGGGER